MLCDVCFDTVLPATSRTSTVYTTTQRIRRISAFQHGKISLPRPRGLFVLETGWPDLGFKNQVEKDSAAGKLLHFSKTTYSRVPAEILLFSATSRVSICKELFIFFKTQHEGSTNWDTKHSGSDENKLL